MTNAGTRRRGSQPTTRPEGIQDLPTGRVIYGPPGSPLSDPPPVSFNAHYTPFGFEEPVYQAVRSGGTEIDRAGRVGVATFAIDSFSGGFQPAHGVKDWGRDKIFYRENTGIFGTWQEGIASISYKTTVNAALASVDASGYRAAGLRVHSVLWPTTSGLRSVWGIGPNVFKTTSTTNPAPGAPSTADNVSDNIMAMWIGPIPDGTLALWIGTDGQTDDIKYTTNPLADSITWVSAVTYGNSADRCWWGYYSKRDRRHRFAGIIDNTPGIFSFGVSASFPLTSATAQPVVYEDGKDLLGDIAVANTGAKTCGTGWAIPGSGNTSRLNQLEQRSGTASAQASESNFTAWSGAANITASDDSYATAAYTHAYDSDSPGSDFAEVIGLIAVLTDVLVGSNNDYGAVPDAAHIIGSVQRAEVKEANAANNIRWWLAQHVLNGSPIGENRAAGDEPGTSDAYASYGASTDRWGLPSNLRGKDINAGQLGFGSQFVSAYDLNTAGKTGTVSVDHMDGTIYYQYPGYLASAPAGAYGVGEHPQKPDNMITVEPETNDSGAINVRRRVAVYVFSRDNEYDRDILTRIEYPDTQHSTIGDCTPYLGGLATAGGSNANQINHVKLTNAQGVTTDLNHPALNGSDTLEISKLTSKGDFLLEDTNFTDFSDAQLHAYVDGKQYVCGALQSYSTAPAAAALQWAEYAGRLDLEQNYHYRFYPVSTTALGVAYEFVPSNLWDDPHLFNTSMVKTDGDPYIVMNELNKGAPEAYKADVVAIMQSRRCDDKTLYGTVQLLGDSGGDFALATPELSVTFPTAAAIFTEAGLYSSAGNPGISHNTMIYKLKASHTNGTAKTPNLLPIAVLMVGKFRQGRTFPVYLTADDWNRYVEIVAALRSLDESDVVQRLNITDVPYENQGDPAKLRYTGVARWVGSDPTTRALFFQETPGSLS